MWWDGGIDTHGANEMKNTKVYIAGPFFNPAQIRVIEQIEMVVAQRKFQMFSPRKSKANAEAITAITAVDVYNDNIKMLCESTIVVAVLDYLLVDEPKLKLTTPDTGTIFEIGYACALRDASIDQNLRVVGFTTRQPADMNLMLTQSLDGVAYGYTELHKWLYGDIDTLPQHKGEHT